MRSGTGTAGRPRRADRGNAPRSIWIGWRPASARAKMGASPSPEHPEQLTTRGGIPMAIAETRTFAPAEGSTIEPKLAGKIRVNADALTEFVAALFRHNNMPADDALISAK